MATSEPGPNGEGDREERALLTAMRHGDEAAWRIAYGRHFGTLYRYVCLRAGRHRQRTEDVVQECWLIAVRRIARFNPDQGRFGTWLRGIADNILRNKRRRWKRRDNAEQPLDDESEPADASAKTGFSSDGREQMALALALLPPHYQAALRAKYAEQYSVAEIAEQHGQTPKAVESLLSRARAAFRKAYNSLNEEPQGHSAHNATATRRK